MTQLTKLFEAIANLLEVGLLRFVSLRRDRSGFSVDVFVEVTYLREDCDIMFIYKDCDCVYLFGALDFHVYFETYDL